MNSLIKLSLYISKWLLISVLAMNTTMAADLDYPTRPIKLIIGLAPGGGMDFLGRLLAIPISDQLKQPVVVDNRPGAGGAIATAEIIKSAPDGYVVSLANIGQLAISDQVAEQPIGDIPNKVSAIGLVGVSPLVLFVPTSLGINTLEKYLEYARANPGKLSYGSGGIGQLSHLAFEQLKAETKVQIEHVPYKGGSPALNDLVAGRLDGMLDVVGVGMPFVKAGKLKILAISSEERSPGYPLIPTFKEAGAPNYVVLGWQGLIAPAGTSPSVVTRLNQVLRKTLESKVIQDAMAVQGYFARPSSPEQFSALVKSDTARWGALMKTLKIDSKK